MRRRAILLLDFTLIVSLAFAGTLSGILLSAPVATATPSAPVATPDGGPDLTSRRVKRQRRHDRKQQNHQQARAEKERKADRKADPKQTDKKPDRKQKDRKRDRSSSAAASKRPTQDRYIVVLEPSAGDAQSAATEIAADADGVDPIHVYENVVDGFAAVIPDDQLADVRNDPRVATVVPDQEVHAYEQILPTGVDRIDADRDPTANIGGQRVDVDVAVIDSGIDSHPDLNVAGGVSCISGNVSYADDNDHGTHVAGTIGALDNADGVVGVAPGARLWAVKVLDADGSGWWSEVICGLDWVAANSDTIDVANMSLGGGGTDSACAANPLHDAICRVVNVGVPVVVAAGNSGQDAAGAVPAAYDEVITVSALVDTDGKPGRLGEATSAGADDTLATFSNFGADVDIAAPGVRIYSTVPGGYARFSGTSMASPHVAGAAALYLAKNPGATPAQVKTALRNAREAIALPNDRDGINEGVLNAGDGPAPTAPVVNPATPTGGGTVAPNTGENESKKDKKKKKKKGKPKRKKRR
jgi:subtilisin family serine protease